MFGSILLMAALAGPHPVGFETVFLRDVSRPDIASTSRGRPLQITLWYPAASRGKTPLKFGEYVSLLGLHLDSVRSPATDNAGRRVFIETARERSGGTSTIEERLPSLLEMDTTAYRSAPPAPGKFPLVAFPEYRAPATNSIIAEALASHGYVVVSLPMIGTFEHDYDGGLTGMETQIADMRVAIAEASRRSFVDHTRLALAGVGISANIAVAYAARNPDVDAIVSLEGGLPSPSENGIMQRTPYYDAAILRAPMLVIQAPFEGRDDTLLRQYRYADRWFVEFPSMKEFYFLNYGAWERTAPGILGQPPGDVASGFEWGIRYVRAFLDSTLRGDRRAIENIGQPPEGLLQARFEKAQPPVPTFVELKRLIQREGVSGLKATYDRLKASEPQPFNRQMVFDLANWFGWQKDEDWAIRHALMTILVDSYPQSARARFALGNACRARREAACAIAAYDETLKLLPADGDTTLDSATRERMTRLASQRRDELRAQSQ